MWKCVCLCWDMIKWGIRETEQRKRKKRGNDFTTLNTEETLEVRDAY